MLTLEKLQETVRSRRHALEARRDESIVQRDYGSRLPAEHDGYKYIEGPRPIRALLASSIPDHIGASIFNFLRKHQLTRVGELGTCLGLGAMYLYGAVLGAADACYLGFEGCPALAALSRESLALLAGKSGEYKIVEGPFADTVPGGLVGAELHCVFLDGFHYENGTVRLFEQLAAHLTSGRYIIVDDLALNKRMAAAWRRICALPRVVEYGHIPGKKAVGWCRLR